MELLLPSAIILFLMSPFAISGYRRAWRGPAMVWILMALYAGYSWTRPMSHDLQETDRLGAEAWQMFLLVLLVGSVVVFALGFAVSARRKQHDQDHAKEAVE